jgi:hypothetical protein
MLTHRLMSREAELATRFIAAWNTADDASRLALLRESCEEHAMFVSPQGVTEGCAGMSLSIGAFRQAFPSACILIGVVDVYYGHMRFPWTTVFGDGRPDLSGDDYAQLGESGLIHMVVSFDGHTRFPGAESS